jgi:hypothetical protein
MFEELLFEWNPWYKEKFKWRGIEREAFKKILGNIKNDLIISIIGVRRSGKTQIFYETIDHLINVENVKPEDILFLKIDDLRIKDKLSIDLILKFIELREELFSKSDRIYLFLDEIQELKNWQQCLKTIYDLNKSHIKIFITGSNSSLIKRNLSSYLTGRELNIEVYPFSFREYLKTKKFYINNKIDILKNRIEIKRHFNEYLKFGGFPEIILFDINKQDYLKQLTETILFKDIVLKYNIKNSNGLLELFRYLITNFGNPINFNKTSKILKISKDSISEYVSIMEEVYLLFRVFIFDYSLKKQLINEKKFYSIDMGILNFLSFRFIETKGMFLENLVFIELKRRGKEIFYHKNKKECDFVIREGLGITEAIQVTQSLSDFDTRKRELQGVVDALKTYNLSEGLILTEDEEEVIMINEMGVEIGDESREIGDRVFIVRVKPVWKWLLE